MISKNYSHQGVSSNTQLQASSIPLSIKTTTSTSYSSPSILINQLEELQQQLRNFKLADGNLSVHYYIVSLKFLNNWRQFCLHPQKTQRESLQLNVDLLNEQKQLRSGLKYKEHYEIVSSGMYDLINQFQGIELKRKPIMLDHKIIVPLYLKKYRYICLTVKDIKFMEQIKNKKINKFQQKIIDLSQMMSVQQFLKEVTCKQNGQVMSQSRGWKISRTTIDSIMKCLNIIALNINVERKMAAFGRLLESSITLQETNCGQQDIIFIQSKEIHKDWFIALQRDIKCQTCDIPCQSLHSCVCLKVFYCTLQCKNANYDHSSTCKLAQIEKANQPITFAFSTKSKRGKVGLKNMGNTCFFNSCLQCLSNTLPLTSYFINKFYEKDINSSNFLGAEGKIAKAYASLIKQLWCSSNSYVSPSHLKSAINAKNEMFAGYAQHDSQELFLFLIDGIHQDLNRISNVNEKRTLNKSSSIQANQMSLSLHQKIIENSTLQEDKALKSWLSYIRYNQSIIVDLMTGQYQSKITCPKCKHQSIAYDPFVSLTLPLPLPLSPIQSSVITILLVICYKNFSRSPSIIYYELQNQTMKCLKQNVCYYKKFKQKETILLLMNEHQIIYDCQSLSMSEIVQEMQNKHMKMILWPLSEEQVVLKKEEALRITVQLSKKGFYSYSQYEAIWFKFPILVNKSTATGQTIYKQFIRMFYHRKLHLIDCQHKKQLSSDIYKEFQQKLLKRRPFKMILRYQKIDVSSHYKVQYKFNKQIEIFDQTQLSAVLQKIDDPFELEVRFTEESFNAFYLVTVNSYFNQAKRKASYGKKYSNPQTQDINLSDCFKEFSKIEKLQSGNQWLCQQCQTKQLPSKQLMIYKLPTVLIIHLKRFKQKKNSMNKQKNKARVIFPLQIDIGQYAIDKTSFKNYRDEARTSNLLFGYQQPDLNRRCSSLLNSQSTVYELYAVNNHFGELGGGHYTAFCKNGKQWYEYNDSQVKQMTGESVCTNGAYMLFYKRKDR